MGKASVEFLHECFWVFCIVALNMQKGSSDAKGKIQPTSRRCGMLFFSFFYPSSFAFGSLGSCSYPKWRQRRH